MTGNKGIADNKVHLFSKRKGVSRHKTKWQGAIAEIEYDLCSLFSLLCGGIDKPLQ